MKITEAELYRIENLIKAGDTKSASSTLRNSIGLSDSADTHAVEVRISQVSIDSHRMRLHSALRALQSPVPSARAAAPPPVCAPPPSVNKYQRSIGKSGAQVDVYDVLVAFNVTCPAMQHAIKKCLAPGQRGAKDSVQDKREAIASIERSIELES